MSRIAKKTVLCLLASVLVTANISVGYAAEKKAEKKDAPMLIPGTTKVSAEDVLDLAEKIPDLLMIDARIRSDRKQGYIEGSVSLPDVETNCKTLAKVIPAVKAPILFYCNGVKCGRSVNSSKAAIKCGYTNIYWFRGGFAEWEAKNFPMIKQ
jgi:rhodanese-related sulfurtransferase